MEKTRNWRDGLMLETPELTAEEIAKFWKDLSYFGELQDILPALPFGKSETIVSQGRILSGLPPFGIPTWGPCDLDIPSIEEEEEDEGEDYELEFVGDQEITGKSGTEIRTEMQAMNDRLEKWGVL